MTETYRERTAGIWFLLAFYVAGGAYMLGIWALYASNTYLLPIFGGLSLLTAVALILISKWAFVIGILTFPLYFIDFVAGLNVNVNLVGWYPNYGTAAFNASMVVYLVFLVLSLILLIDKRNVLKSDRILDLMRGPVVQTPKTEKGAD